MVYGNSFNKKNDISTTASLIMTNNSSNTMRLDNSDYNQYSNPQKSSKFKNQNDNNKQNNYYCYMTNADPIEQKINNNNDLELCKDFLINQKAKSKLKNKNPHIQETVYNYQKNTKTVQNGNDSPVEYFNCNFENNGYLNENNNMADNFTQNNNMANNFTQNNNMANNFTQDMYLDNQQQYDNSQNHYMNYDQNNFYQQPTNMGANHFYNDQINTHNNKKEERTSKNQVNKNYHEKMYNLHEKMAYHEKMIRFYDNKSQNIKEDENSTRYNNNYDMQNYYANPYENVNQSVPYNNQHDQYSYEDFNINQKYNDPSNFNNIQYNENPQFGDSNYDNTNSGYYGMNNYDNQQRLKEQNTGQHISQGQGFNTMPDEFKPELNYNGNRFDNMQQLGCPTYEMDIDYVSYNNNESEADYDSQIQKNQQGLTNTSIDHNKNLNKNVSSNRMLQN